MPGRRGMRIAWTAAAILPVAAGLACSSDRATEGPVPTYASEVGAILSARCAECHSGSAPAAGWRATSYLETIACVDPGGTPAAIPRDATAPLIAALDTEPHIGRLNASERAVVEAWVRAGAPAFQGTVH